MYANAGRLFLDALDLSRGVSSLNAASVQAKRECLASVMFAAMSAEAFINELQQLATDAAGHSTEVVWIKVLGEVLEEAESSRGSIELKYQLAKLVLAGCGFDRGAQPFQDFTLLVSVRNLVVHGKPKEAVRRKEADGELAWETKIMTNLAARGVVAADDFPFRLIPPGDKVTVLSNLLAELSTQAVAAWACRAAAGIVNAILDAIPVGTFSAMTEVMYRKSFQGIDDLVPTKADLSG